MRNSQVYEQKSKALLNNSHVRTADKFIYPSFATDYIYPKTDVVTKIRG